MNKKHQPTKKDVFTDKILRKGHYHPDKSKDRKFATCRTCGGDGYFNGKICPDCDGYGE